MLAFLYHRIGSGKYANPPALMEEHLAWLAKRFHTVLPGESLSRTSICLTFDDATYDFYHYAFPLLKKLKLRALLAVPVHYILDSSALDPEIRLSVPYSSAMKGDTYRTHAPFCTWQELREIAGSGLVEIASHSIHHRHLLEPGVDLMLEVAGSKQILEEKLQIPIKTFVYPLGKFNRKTQSLVKKHYPFAMRIGTALNTSWQNWNGVIYRILSDNLTSVDQHFRWKRRISSGWFYILNSLRGR